MKLVLDTARCQGHARCNATAPDLFELDEYGYSSLTELEVPPGRELAAADGVSACPERALRIE